MASLTLESGIYLAIGALALALRLFHLGASPLTPAESTEALAAWRLAHGFDTVGYVAGSSQLLTSLVTVTFWVFGASDAAARVWPALAGGAVAFAPAFFRRELGRKAALAATALLAVSPALIAASRTADGATLAAACLLGFIVALRALGRSGERRHAVVCGAFLGTGLTAGPTFISAAFVASLAYLAHAWLAGYSWQAIAPSTGQRAQLPAALLSAAVAFFAVASLFGLHGGGLSNAGSGLPTWLLGWLPAAATRPVVLVPGLIALYEPLALILGLAGMWLVRRGDRVAQALLVWAAVGLAFGIVYVGRQSTDVLWVSIPLTLLAARVLVAVFCGDWSPGAFETVLGQTAVLVLLLAFAGINLANFAHAFESASGAEVSYLSLGLALAVVALFAVTALLFAAGWTSRSALRAAVAAITVVGLAASFRAGWGVAYAHVGDPRELWATETVSPNIKLLVESLEDISLRHVGHARDVEIAVLGERIGPLGWHLRDFTNVRWVETLGPSVSSPVVITGEDIANPALGSSYLGQTFAVVSRWEERLDHPAGVVGYVLFRNVQSENERLVVWVREDVQLLQE